MTCLHKLSNFVIWRFVPTRVGHSFMLVKSVFVRMLQFPFFYSFLISWPFIDAYVVSILSWWTLIDCTSTYIYTSWNTDLAAACEAADHCYLLVNFAFSLEFTATLIISTDISLHQNSYAHFKFINQYFPMVGFYVVGFSTRQFEPGFLFYLFMLDCCLGHLGLLGVLLLPSRQAFEASWASVKFSNDGM